MKTRSFRPLGQLRTRALLLGAALLCAMPARACPADPYIGALCAFGGNFAPRNWTLAQGQLLPISQNTALFSLLGTTYGGDGRVTFALPDLRGRTPIGAGQGPGLSRYHWGEKSGTETVTLLLAEIPGHNHSATTEVTLTLDNATATAHLMAIAAPGDANNPAGRMPAQNALTGVYSTSVPNVQLAADAIELSANGTVTADASTQLSLSGSSQPHENRMPYLTVNWIIALYGIFPPRN